LIGGGNRRTPWAFRIDLPQLWGKLRSLLDFKERHVGIAKTEGNSETVGGPR
jgi:hypothetical protein